MPKAQLDNRSARLARLPDERLFRPGARASVIVLGIALWLAIVFAYVPSDWAMIIYRLIEDGTLALLWALAGAGLGSVMLRALRIGLNDEPLLAFVTSAGLGIGACSLLILGLGLAGWLSQATAIALLAAGLLAGIARLALDRWSPQALRSRLAMPARWGWVGLIAVPFAALTTVGTMVPPGMLWTPDEPHGYDVVEYHLQIPREWYEAGRIIPLHHNVFSYFPFNVEMHYLLAMHLRGGPWAGMYLAQMMHGILFALAVLAACAFAGQWTRPAREAAGRESPSKSIAQKATSAPLLAGVALATTPLIPQLAAIAYDEGGFILFGLLSIGWTIRALDTPARPIRCFALSGAFAGLACGVKLTAVPEILLAVPFAALVVLLANRSLRAAVPSLWRRFAGPVLCGLIGLAVFSPWLARTAAWSHGNPVFPELAPMLGRGDFDDAQIERWHNAHAARPDERSLRARLHAGWTEVLANWQFGFLLVPAGIAGLLVTLRSPRTQFLAVTLLVLAIIWLFFTHLQGRFFVLAVPLCALLVGSLATLDTWAAMIPVLAQAAIGFIILNAHFIVRPVWPVLGKEDLTSWATPDAIESVPKDAPLALVGDERVFVYQRPMSLLTYRTVFDVKSSRGSLIDAFAGPRPAGQRQYLLISPDELERFARTYQPFPSVPPDIARHREPYVVER